MKCNFLETRRGILTQAQYDDECSLTDRKCPGQKNCILWMLYNKVK